MKRYARTALALALAVASGSAAALGLGQIEVKSRIGQPLVAEIRIISSDPSELEALQANLASPETFARIGLRPPDGVVADLHFTSALDAAGNPVIRVTSNEPVTEPLITFLVEVDWGQGRLVREYSALLDTPRTVSAPAQPEIAAAQVEAPNTIERPQDSAEALADADPQANSGQPTDADADAVGDVPSRNPDSATNDDNAIATAEPTPAPAPAPTYSPPPPAPAPANNADGSVAVQRGDTLSSLAAQMRPQGLTLDQTMIALLRANPEAFIGGNINRLKAGANLRMPGDDVITTLDAGQASALVSVQAREWRQSRRAIPQPAAAAGLVARGEPAAASPATPDNTPAAGARNTDARLEIVPPGASQATQAGTQSGINAGGEGDMLRQDIQQETIAAREAEVAELKGRVAELEQLQQKQQQLIAMKDTELAAAQQRLAQSTQSQTQAGGMPTWGWGLGALALLAVALVGWLARRRPARTVFRAPVEDRPSPLAQAFAEPAADRIEPMLAQASEAEPEAAVEPPSRTAPAWHVANSGPTFSGPTDAIQPGQERLELARAYLDLGDQESARQLLGEIVVGGDHAARQAAVRMLKELG